MKERFKCILYGVAVICFCQPAFADEFGDTMARVLCSHDQGNAGIILTEDDELKAWDQAHEGVFFGWTSQYTFKKNAGTDAACFAQQRVPPGPTLVADVTIMGRAVRMGAYR